MHWLPLLGVLAFLGFGVALRAILTRRRTGTFGVVLFAHGRAQQLRDALVLLLFTALTVQAVVVAAWHRDPADLDWSLPYADSWPWTGALLQLLGLALLLLAQARMGPSWRFGIDAGSRPGLVTTGIYRFCRNPIYLGLFLFLAGFLALVPTWVSLLQLLGALVGVQLQVRDEEAWLQRTYGDDYLAYAARTGRYWPRLRHR